MYTLTSPFVLDTQFMSRNLNTGIAGGISGISRVSFPDEVPLRGLMNSTMGPWGGKIFFKK
jgi:hypothetical protein